MAVIPVITKNSQTQTKAPIASTSSRIIPVLTRSTTQPIAQPKQVSQPKPTNFFDSAKSVFQGIQKATQEAIERGKNAKEKLRQPREGLGAPIGRFLQKTPDTTIKVPKGSLKSRIIGITPPVDEITEFLTGLPGSIAQSYGRSLELLSTPEGKKQLKEGAKNLPKTMNEVKTHIDNKEWGKAFETAFSNPAVSVAFDVSDFIPATGLIGLGIKKGLRKTAQQVVKEGIEEADGTFVISDGTHRVQIAKDLGIKEIPIKVVESKAKGVKNLKVKGGGVKDFQSRVIAGQDLGKEIGKKVNPDGTITLYHGTSKASAEKILKEGFNDGAFFSVHKSGTQYGDSPLDVAKRKFGKEGTVLEIKVDARGLESAAAGSEVFSPKRLVRGEGGVWRLSQQPRGVGMPKELEPLAQEARKTSEAEFVSSNIFGKSIVGAEQRAIEAFPGKSFSDKLSAFYRQATGGVKGIIEAKPKPIEVKPKAVSVPREQLPVASKEGIEKASRLEARVTKSLDKTPQEIKDQLGSTFTTMNKKENIAKASRYVTESPDDAMAVLRGEKEAPKGILKNSIYVAMENQAIGDASLARKLASLQSTRAGQELSILTEIDPNSPVKLMRDIVKIREEAFKQRYGGRSAGEVSEKIVKDIKSKVKVPDKYDWNNFIRNLPTC